MCIYCFAAAGKCSTDEDVLFCRTKENQKGRRCPEGMKAPVGLLSRRPVCKANAACSARQGRSDFDALDPTGCGTLRLLRALGGTRILQAAASTAPPCFGRWPRSSPLQTKGCTPLIIPKQLGSIQKIQVAALKDFLCCADLKSLRDGRRPTAAYAVCRYDPSREKVNQKNPQIFLIYKLKIKFPLNMARAERRPF